MRLQPQARNTPAYAGKTPRRAAPGGERRKHPRLRGEDRTSLSGRPPRTETPPLTRGRPDLAFGAAAAHRNTPAYAGKTRSISHSSLKCWKHPRLRGEDHNKAYKYGVTPETPPLTRGRPRRAGLKSSCFRNTPAYAGKTKREATLRTSDQKHPRLRGEDPLTSRRLTPS